MNVKWFGAAGDAETDDTVALQAAEDYCQAKGHSLFLPKGRYLINSFITKYGNVGWHGESRDLVTIEAGASHEGNLLLIAAERSHITMSEVTFSGTARMAAGGESLVAYRVRPEKRLSL